MYTLTIYWENGQSDPMVFGSFEHAHRAAMKTARLNSGKFERMERAGGKWRYYGSTPFGAYEAVLKKIS